MADNIPPIFYKFYPIDLNWLPDLFMGKSIQFSSRTSFNDPYDSRAGYQVKAETPEGIAYILNKLARMGYPPAKRLPKLKQIQHQSREPAMFGHRELEADLDRVGVLSLSETWDNMLLWSHYAKDHKGICIGFHSDRDVFGAALKVHYTDDFPIINPPFDSPDAILRKSFLTKARCWEYEKEWRIIKRVATEAERARLRAEYAGHRDDQVRALSDHRGAGLYTFDQAAIASVTIGMKTPEPVAIDVLRTIDRAGLKIPLYVIGPPGVGYNLNRHQFMG